MPFFTDFPDGFSDLVSRGYFFKPAQSNKIPTLSSISLIFYHYSDVYGRGVSPRERGFCAEKNQTLAKWRYSRKIPYIIVDELVDPAIVRSLSSTIDFPSTSQHNPKKFIQ